ncbi:hypothetical protein [Streptomyces yokosukanensis]|uniref:hypothetical protein n=1 Tax=Streptomyces yokosukanensis TaxID=67386 RepID=UPI000AEF4695|nr:hypothetical protein [Streptomyces yokosukanensis]
MSIKKRALTLMAVGALLGIPLIGVSAANASAANVGPQGLCFSTAIPADTSSGVFRLKKTLPLKKGPYTGCADAKFALEGRKFYAWCYYTNLQGNLWYYGSEAIDGDKGWVYVGNLTFLSGTLKPCPQA